MVGIISRCESLAIVFTEMHREETELVSNELTGVNDVLPRGSVEVRHVDNGTALDTNSRMAFGRIDNYLVSIPGEFRLVSESHGMHSL